MEPLIVPPDGGFEKWMDACDLDMFRYTIYVLTEHPHYAAELIETRRDFLRNCYQFKHASQQRFEEWRRALGRPVADGEPYKKYKAQFRRRVMGKFRRYHQLATRAGVRESPSMTRFFHTFSGLPSNAV